MTGELPDPASIDSARRWLDDAESVLVTAGAGLTAAAGINYADTELFAREFPAMLQYGFTAQYQFIGFTDWDPELQWGYWAAHVDLVRFRWPPTRTYETLERITSMVGPEGRFVLTSNVDAMFERNGFPADRVHTPQGDYALLQCITPCTRQVWPWKPQIDAIVAATDPDTQRLTDSSLIPRCPNCGETVFPNVRGDASFIEDHFAPTADGFHRWLQDHRSTRGVVIEVGAGFNTPSVIRWPSETIVENLEGWRLIRVNMTHPDIPDSLEGRAVGLGGDADQILTALAATSS